MNMWRWRSGRQASDLSTTSDLALYIYDTFDHLFVICLFWKAHDIALYINLFLRPNHAHLFRNITEWSFYRNPKSLTSYIWYLWSFFAICFFNPFTCFCPQKAAQEEEKEKQRYKKILSLHVFLIFRCPKRNQWAGLRGPGWAGGLPLLS